MIIGRVYPWFKLVVDTSLGCVVCPKVLAITRATNKAKRRKKKTSLDEFGVEKFTS